MNKKVMALFLLSLVGCKTQTMGPVNSDNTEVPRVQKNTCMNLCSNIDMQLGAMVIISNRAGCVCEVKPGTARKGGSASTAAGAAVALLEEDEERRRQEAKRREEERRRQQQQRQLYN